MDDASAHLIRPSRHCVTMKSSKHGLSVLLLFASGIGSLVGATHTHHRHGDIVERIMHKKRPSSESNLDSNGTDSAQGTFDPSFAKEQADVARAANLEDSTIPLIGCHGPECGLNPLPTPILPPEHDSEDVHIRSLVLEPALAVTPSRRRPHNRPTSMSSAEHLHADVPTKEETGVSPLTGKQSPIACFGSSGSHDSRYGQPSRPGCTQPFQISITS